MDFSGAFSWMNIRFLLEGLKVTVEVSLFSIIFSFLIGGLTGVIRFANIPFFSKILGVVIDIIDHFLHLLCLTSNRHSDEHLLVRCRSINDF